MKPKIKKVIIGNITGVIIYAMIMAGFDYANKESFKAWQFLWNVLFFFTVLSLLIRYNLKKKPKERKTPN